MTSRVETKNTFLEGPILPSLLKFAIPVMLTIILQALYGAVDLWAAGKFAATGDISAITTGSQTMMIITGLVSGMSMGSTILLGQNIGNHNEKGAAKVFCTSIIFFAVLGIFLSLIMFFGADFICVKMNVPNEAYLPTLHYIQICGSGTVFIVAYNVLSAIFRGMGDSKSPLYFVAIASIINIVGDVILMKFFNMGAAGAAIATVFAQMISVVFSLFLIKKNGLPFTITKDDFKFNAESAKHVVRLGTPIALQDLCNEISYLIIIGLVNILGVVTSAGVGISEKIIIFMFMVPIGYMQSISAFTAQNIGAGNIERARKAMWQGMGTAAILGILLAYLTFFHGDFLSTFFIKDLGSAESDAVIAASAEFLKASSVECLILSAAYCLTGYFNGVGRTTFVMVQGLCSIFLVKIPFAYYASMKAEPVLFEIGFASALAAIFTFVVAFAYYFVVKNKDIENNKMFEQNNL